MAKSSIRIKQIVIDAMLAAMVAVLGYVAIESNAIKLTFETLPIIVAAMMLGPIDGIAVAGVGTLIYQLLRYGISITTVLWILPYIIEALFIGVVAKKNSFDLSKIKGIILVMAGEIIITVLNTGVIYVDAKIYGYYTPALILGSLAVRFIVAVVKGGVYGFIVPVFIERVKGAVR